MKIALILRAVKARPEAGSGPRVRLVHTGQHYGERMSGDLFRQLGIPDPNVNLEVGSGTQAEQTAAIMVRYEQLLPKECSELCLAVGDVTSTMACAIAAQKLCVPVAHVEGGIRSGDLGMPEEINRLVTDATSEVANANLRQAGVSDERAFFVGNTMIDTLLANLPHLRPPAFWAEAGLQKGGYFVMTLHRPANVDDSQCFAKLLRAVGEGVRDLPVVFPVHPRMAKTLAALPDRSACLHLVDPQPYLEFNYLVRHARDVTDSGGVTEEAKVMGVPCVTLRDTTKRPETVTVDTNELIGTDPAALNPALDRLFDGKGSIPERRDGRAGARIVAELERLLRS